MTTTLIRIDGQRRGRRCTGAFVLHRGYRCWTTPLVFELLLLVCSVNAQSLATGVIVIGDENCLDQTAKVPVCDELRAGYDITVNGVTASVAWGVHDAAQQGPLATVLANAINSKSPLVTASVVSPKVIMLTGAATSSFSVSVKPGGARFFYLIPSCYYGPNSLGPLSAKLGACKVVNGGAKTCVDFFIQFLDFIDADVPDPGWVLVQRSDPNRLLRSDPNYLLGMAAPPPKFRSVSGTVTHSAVSDQDFPDVHESHDSTIDILLDPIPLGSLPILSDLGKDSGKGSADPIDECPSWTGTCLPDTLETEWETGILTNDFTGDGTARFFPKWAWPVEGDRVWENGYWIFDCGHPVEGHTHAEIHPIRAIASMRQQVATPPNTFLPIPVTATDLYVHGRAGIVTDIVECSQNVILDDRACPTRSGTEPRGCDTKDGLCHDPVLDHLGVPINENFEFDICTPRPSKVLPPKPVLKTWILAGPGNTVSDPTRDPVLQTVPVGDPSTDACASPGFGPLKVHVTVPLADKDQSTSILPDDVYSRRIYAGWMEAPDLRHFRIKLDNLRVSGGFPDDTYLCNCAFFWMSVDRAPNQWIRLSDFATTDMNNFDLENQYLQFGDGATFDLFVLDGQPITIRAHGYDQRCLEGHFGHHDFRAHADFNLFVLDFPNDCYLQLASSPGASENSPFTSVKATLDPSNGYGVGQQTLCFGGVLLNERDGCGYSGTHFFDFALGVTVQEITPVPLLGDVNGDGKVNCGDINVIRMAFGKSFGQDGYVVSADINGDGVIDTWDLSIVGQKLPTQTACP
jgi:hypothetical protein